MFRIGEFSKIAQVAASFADGMTMEVRELEPIQVALTAVRYGGPEKGNLSYASIGAWAEKHQYRLVGPGREVFIVPPKPGHEADMVVEIQFPVEAP